jgi:2-methylisocitrate lyase-like PEP mutase family enzyme
LIRAVKDRVPELFVNARTDTHWLAGDRAPDLAETLTRVRGFAMAGADGVFVPGLADDAGIRAVVESVDLPVNLLYLPGRLDSRRAGALGVGRISTGSLLFRTALTAAVDAITAIRAGEQVAGDPAGYQDVQRLVGHHRR